MFEYSVHLPEEGRYQYKFKVDGEWKHDDTKVSQLPSPP